MMRRSAISHGMLCVVGALIVGLLVAGCSELLPGGVGFIESDPIPSPMVIGNPDDATDPMKGGTIILKSGETLDWSVNETRWFESPNGLFVLELCPHGWLIIWHGHAWRQHGERLWVAAHDIAHDEAAHRLTRDEAMALYDGNRLSLSREGCLSLDPTKDGNVVTRDIVLPSGVVWHHVETWTTCEPGQAHPEKSHLLRLTDAGELQVIGGDGRSFIDSRPVWSTPKRTLLEVRLVDENGEVDPAKHLTLNDELTVISSDAQWYSNCGGAEPMPRTTRDSYAISHTRQTTTEHDLSNSLTVESTIEVKLPLEVAEVGGSTTVTWSQQEAYKESTLNEDETTTVHEEETTVYIPVDKRGLVGARMSVCNYTLEIQGGVILSYDDNGDGKVDTTYRYDDFTGTVTGQVKSSIPEVGLLRTKDCD